MYQRGPGIKLPEINGMLSDNSFDQKSEIQYLLIKYQTYGMVILSAARSDPRSKAKLENFQCFMTKNAKFGPDSKARSDSRSKAKFEPDNILQ